MPRSGRILPACSTAGGACVSRISEASMSAIGRPSIRNLNGRPPVMHLKTRRSESARHAKEERASGTDRQRPVQGGHLGPLSQHNGPFWSGPGALGSGHSNLLKNKLKTPDNTTIWGLIDQFSCKNCPIKDGGC